LSQAVKEKNLLLADVDSSNHPMLFLRSMYGQYPNRLVPECGRGCEAPELVVATPAMDTEEIICAENSAPICESSTGSKWFSEDGLQ
jgi:hypothetical protein